MTPETARKKPGPSNPGPSAEVRRHLLEVAEQGATNRDAAALAGVGERTLYTWLAHPDYEDFASAYTTSRAFGRMRSITLIANSTDWRAHAWLLERVDPEHWGKGETDPSDLVAKLSAYIASVDDR
jgi:hypothetical protein